MARIPVGGTATVDQLGKVATPGASAVLYLTRLGGTPIADVIDEAGAAIPGGIITIPADGIFPLVRPEVGALTAVWVSVNGGPRQWLPAHNSVAGAVDSGQSTLSERAAPPTRKAVAAGTLRIVVMGDSKIEGVGASDREHSWQRKLLATLRATYGSADTGYGYWPAISGHPFVVPNPALAGATATALPNAYGLGMKAVRLGINDTLTYPAQQATKITVFYSRTMFFGGTADVLIDGAVVGSINSAGAEESGRTVSYTVSAGAHTVQIKGTSGSASAVVEGVLFETASSGVKLFDGAHGGYRADLFAQGGADIGSYDADDRHYEAVAAANPHLVIIGLGANDMAGVSVGFGVPVNATAFGSYLSTIVTRLRAAAPGCAIVFVMSTRRLGDTTNPEILTDHEEAARKAIGSLPGVTILYESSLWLPNTSAPQDDLGWLADSVHPSDLGHAEIARHVADRLGDIVADVSDFATAEQGAKADAANAALVPLPAATGTNDTTAIQAVLTANPGKRITGRPGSLYRISAPLVISSGTTLDMTGCTVTLIAGSNCRMIQNAALSGAGARDVDITIRGGFWDRGANGGTTSNDSHSFVFHRADRVAMTDMRFNATGPCKYAFYFVDVTDATAERLYIDSTSDGVHITGPASRVIVRDISGKCDDDIVSFTGRDYTNFELTAGGGDISEILVDHVVCRGGVDPNTVKLLPGAGKTLSNAVVRNISGSPATSAVVLYSDAVQASTTGGILDSVTIDGVTGTPGQRYVLVSHPDVRGLKIRNVNVTNNVTRAISFNLAGTITDATVDGVTTNDTFAGYLFHVGTGQIITRLALTNITLRSSGSLAILLGSGGALGNLQMANISQLGGYSGVIIEGGTCPTVSITGLHSTASNSAVRLSAAVAVEVLATGITAYPSSHFAIILNGSLTLRAGTIADGGPLLARTASQPLRAVGLGAKVNVSLLTATAGDIVTNTNAALACGVGPVISNGTLWKHLYTGATT